jgi:hypothetical protein
MKATALLLLMVGVAFPLVVGYHVEPVKAEWSGWTSQQAPNNRVSEVLTCNFDSLAYVELFAGAKDAGGAYTAIVLDSGAELTRSAGDTVLDHGWISFSDWDNHVAYTKGKQYEFRFTRSGSDSIQYYYQGGNPALSDPYSWGWMRVGGTDEVCMDLCARVYGRMNAIDTTFWGATCLIPSWEPPYTQRNT